MALAKQAPERSGKSVTTGQPAAPKAQRAGPSSKQMDLGKGLNHVVRGGSVIKATTTPPTNPHPNPPPQPITEAPKQPIVTARPQKPELKSTAVPKWAAGKSKKKAAASVKTAATTPSKPNLVVTTQSPTSPRGNLRYPRSPSPPCMCGADSSGPHVHLLPPHRGSSPTHCPEDHHSFCSRIWQHALGGQRDVKRCASPVETGMECAAGSLNWSIFSTSKVSIFVS